MFEYNPELFNLTASYINQCNDNIPLAIKHIDQLISKASSLHDFTYITLLTEMKDYLIKASNDMKTLKETEKAVRTALNIEDKPVDVNAIKGFSTVSVNKELLTVDTILAIVSEINSASNPYGHGDERMAKLTYLYGEKVADAVQKTINNNGVVPKYIADVLNSDDNNITIDFKYKDANFSTLKELANNMTDLAQSVLNSGNPQERYQEINSQYGEKVAQLVYDMVSTGNVATNGGLFLQILNRGLLDSEIKPKNLENDTKEDTIKRDETIAASNADSKIESKRINLADTVVANPSNIFSKQTDQRILYAYNKMRNDFGYTDEGAKAMLANLLNENSQMDPTVTNSAGAFGICQWLTKERKASLENFCRDNGYDVNSMDGQLEFMNYELKNDYNNMANGADYGKLHDQLTGKVDRDYTNIAQNITIFYEAPSFDSSENNKIGLTRANSENARAASSLVDRNTVNI